MLRNCSEYALNLARERLRYRAFATLTLRLHERSGPNWVRDAWGELDDTARQHVLANARALGVAAALPASQGEAEKDIDAKAADSLEDILRELAHCEYITLSLSGWKEQSNEFLDDDSAATTVLLFDRDFRREKEGTEHEGVNLIREVQVKDVGYSGLISHTVRRGGEYNAWTSIAADHDLVRDKFVVIAKERLTSDTPDYYGFLGMLRLVALSGRYASVKSMAWDIFTNSFDKAKTAMESLSVLDFDRIVFESSRREGVWEPETLFRVFGILIRKEAQLELHGDRDISAAVAERVASAPCLNRWPLRWATSILRVRRCAYRDSRSTTWAKN